MLLFPQKEEKTIFAEKVFYIFSTRQEVIEKLSQQLRVEGFSHVKEIFQDLLTAQDVTFSPNATGIIIDIGSHEQTEKIVSALEGLVPRHIWCCVAGDSDSITLAQAFARHGIHYFNLSAQVEELLMTATSGISTANRRRAVTVSVLGCKGGIGTSSIAWKLAQQIAQIRLMPLLLIQGSTGSRDLDLRINKKMLQDVVISFNKHLDVMIQDSDSLPDSDQQSYEKYNFVVFEGSIVPTSKEVLRQLVEKTSCLVLVIDRSMSSIRTVRQVMEIIDIMNRSHTAPRRLLLCLSDSRPVTIDMLGIEDLQSLLARPLDIVFPYQKTRSLLSFYLTKKELPEDLLTQRVLGGAAPLRNPLLRYFPGNR